MTIKEEAEIEFCWLDHEGTRCGPRHRSFKAALNYQKNWRGDGTVEYWVTVNGKPQMEKESREGKYPSSKQPKELVICSWSYRELSEEEQRKVELATQLSKEGWI